MGQHNTIQKCNFEDIQDICFENNTQKFILLNTISQNKQHCLIKNTISINSEEKIINILLNDQSKHDTHIFIYGENSNDNTVLKKYQQLLNLGFNNIFIYSGGLFEWLCLQDIYGDDDFPTTNKEIDILKYRPQSLKKNNLITDIDY